MYHQHHFLGIYLNREYTVFMTFYREKSIKQGMIEFKFVFLSVAPIQDLITIPKTKKI